MASWTLEGGEVLYNTHEEGTCFGEHCTLHKMSAHHMRDFPQHWRSDRALMERICPHGIGHPDPDDFRIRSGWDDGTHGCDGCCGTPQDSDA